MRNRLDSDRRCFAFFHPKITHEPLLFIEIALVNEMPESIMKLWDQESSAIKAREAQAAILYAVTNTQKGLAGVRLGDFLIKRVIEKLSQTLANIRHFATLSPVPGFRPWLISRLEANDTGMLLDIDVEVIQTLSGNKKTAPGLLTLLNSDWHINPDLADPLGHILMRLCANYLLNVRRENEAHDPVAHFHFVNGARLERLNWLADKSKKGLAQSFGIMANYVYRPGEIEENHEQYASAKALSASKDVRALLKPAS
jgi:malonyl-CoA decarboxylase